MCFNISWEHMSSWRESEAHCDSFPTWILAVWKGNGGCPVLRTSAYYLLSAPLLLSPLRFLLLSTNRPLHPFKPSSRAGCLSAGGMYNKWRGEACFNDREPQVRDVADLLRAAVLPPVLRRSFQFFIVVYVKDFCDESKQEKSNISLPQSDVTRIFRAIYEQFCLISDRCSVVSVREETRFIFSFCWIPLLILLNYYLTFSVFESLKNFWRTGQYTSI